MPTRRGQGEGSISQRTSDGLWTARIDLGYVNGKRKRKQIYGKTRKEVAEQLKVLLRDQQQGLPIALERQTVEQFFTRWLTEKVKPRKRPKTYESYSQLVRLYIIPGVGKIQLDKLTAQDIEILLNRKLKEGLSPRTVQYIRAVIRMGLAQALRWNMVVRNVATLTEAVHVDRFVTHPLTQSQAQLLLDTARGDRLEALYCVALSLGLRKGEALGLRWADIDLDARTLQVSGALHTVEGKLVLGATKTATSRRTIPLPTPLVAVLRAHRARQAAEQDKAGSHWHDHGLVFTTGLGTPISPRNIVRSFKALLQRAGLPDIRFHDLRHSCASLLAAQGVPARVAMEVLGHSSIQTTQNIYTHVFDDAKRQATEGMGALFERGTQET